MELSFSRWLQQSELGRYLLEREQAYFDRAVADVFGFHAVQLGLPEVNFLRANRIAWQCRAAARGPVNVACDAAQLPFETRSLDLLLLPHVLDFTTQPHQVLREAERVLMPEGRLVLTGFNPVSLWGVRRLIQGREQAPWSGAFLPPVRIRDWMTLLELEPVGGGNIGYAPPFSQQDWLERFHFMERAGAAWWPLAAGVYGIEAIKRQRGMRLITPRWKPAKAPGALAVAGGNERHHGQPSHKHQRDAQGGVDQDENA